MSELLGTALFLAGLILAAIKVARDVGERGLWGYAILLVITVVLAAGVGVAWS